MKWHIDGDQICITLDDFVNLQESPAVFVPRDSEQGQAIEQSGRVSGLPVGDLRSIYGRLQSAKHHGDALPQEPPTRGRNKLFKT